MGYIYGQGILEEDLKTLLDLFVTNFNGVTAKLAADSGVNGTTAYTDLDLTANVSAKSQYDILTSLQQFITNFNAVLAVLDADSGVNDTNYDATLAITDVIDSVTAGNIYQNGLNQGNLVKLLNTCITQFNLLNAKLDADTDTSTGTEVADTDYAATWDITDTVDESGCDDN